MPIAISSAALGDGFAAYANDAGDVAGSTRGHPGNLQAFLKVGAEYRHIAYGEGHGINNSRQIVGELIVPTVFDESVNPDRSLHGPFYWDTTLGAQLLRNSAIGPAWFITAAGQINDAGAIVATGNNTKDGRRERALLLVPTQ